MALVCDFNVWNVKQYVITNYKWKEIGERETLKMKMTRFLSLNRKHEGVQCITRVPAEAKTEFARPVSTSFEEKKNINLQSVCLGDLLITFLFYSKKLVETPSSWLQKGAGKVTIVINHREVKIVLSRSRKCLPY